MAYDPVKAHEYYMKYRKKGLLKGRKRGRKAKATTKKGKQETLVGLTTAGLNDNGKMLWAMKKKELQAEMNSKLAGVTDPVERKNIMDDYQSKAMHELKKIKSDPYNAQAKKEKASAKSSGSSKSGGSGKSSGSSGSKSSGRGSSESSEKSSKDKTSEKEKKASYKVENGHSGGTYGGRTAGAGKSVTSGVKASTSNKQKLEDTTKKQQAEMEKAKEKAEKEAAKNEQKEQERRAKAEEQAKKDHEAQIAEVGAQIEQLHSKLRAMSPEQRAQVRSAIEGQLETLRKRLDELRGM